MQKKIVVSVNVSNRVGVGKVCRSKLIANLHSIGSLAFHSGQCCVRLALRSAFAKRAALCLRHRHLLDAAFLPIAGALFICQRVGCSSARALQITTDFFGMFCVSERLISSNERFHVADV